MNCLCSIIIPVYDRVQLTKQCLEALFSEPFSSGPVEVIVIDDGSRDSTPELLASYGSRIRTITHQTNQGYATACNDGARVAAGTYLEFLNNDTQPQPGWLDALVSHAGEHTAAGLVGSKLLSPDGTVQHAGIVICQDGLPRHIYQGFPRDHPAVNKSRRFQCVTGAALLVRRDAFEAAGGFDQAFRNGYEDVDLCLRLGRIGFETHYCHRSVLIHLASVSDGRFAHDEANTELFQQRWGASLRPDDLDYYITDDLLRVEYAHGSSLTVRVMPELGAAAGYDAAADALLSRRAAQVFTLLRENTLLSVRLSEALRQPADLPSKSRSNGASGETFSEPRILAEGAVHTLGQQREGRIVSVLLPTKNGATHLQANLPLILGQKGVGALEIIAVDSGSQDRTLDVLEQFQAKIIQIDPSTFNHGLTRNLLANHARGEIVVFINQDTEPANDEWLINLISALDRDVAVAGACSSILPARDADRFALRQGLQEFEGTRNLGTRWIRSWGDYAALQPNQLRAFICFHSVSAAIRADVLRQIPFRDVVIAEDLQWAKEALEAGYRIRQEPSSLIHHSHNYSHLEWFRRNVDDGQAARAIVGARVSDQEILPAILEMARADWAYGEQICQLTGAGLEEWRVQAVLRRVAQMVGLWIGTNELHLNGNLASRMSLTGRLKSGLAADSP